MDKIIRNVIIFAVTILLIAGIAIVLVMSNSGPSVEDNIPMIPDKNPVVTGEYQAVKLSVSGGTYILTPSVLKKDVPVRMEADLSTVRGCARDVVISAFGVRKYVKEGDNIITFTPTKTGTINIACSMNMYRGTFTVE